jgi:hypothetical protein
MRRAQSTTTSLKLFPRLATSSRRTAAAQSERPQKARNRNAPTGIEPRPIDRDHVRARLLQMILNNERARRDGQRPNAS